MSLALAPTPLARQPSTFTYSILSGDCFPWNDDIAPDPCLELLAEHYQFPIQIPEQAESRTRSKGSACAECGHWFKSNSELDEHGRLMNHFAFMCKVAGCDKAYTRRDSYVRHRNGHKNAGQVCQLCKDEVPKMFSRKDHLMSHIRRKHPESIKTDHHAGQQCVQHPTAAKSSLGSASGPKLIELGSLASSAVPRLDVFLRQEGHTMVPSDEDEIFHKRMGLKYVAGALRSIVSHPTKLGEFEREIDGLSNEVIGNLCDQLALTMTMVKLMK